MKVLVLGGFGFIGAHVVGSLLGRGHQVRVLEWPGRRPHQLVLPRCNDVELVEGDFLDPDTVSAALQGVEVTNLTPQTAERLGVPPSTTGVVVADIDPASKIADSGLRKGDVIQEVNHQAVKNVSEFQNAVKKAGSDPLLLVNRQGRTLFIAA